MCVCVCVCVSCVFNVELFPENCYHYSQVQTKEIKPNFKIFSVFFFLSLIKSEIIVPAFTTRQGCLYVQNTKTNPSQMKTD